MFAFCHVWRDMKIRIYEAVIICFVWVSLLFEGENIDDR
jgi:hypothetical protein